MQNLQPPKIFILSAIEGNVKDDRTSAEKYRLPSTRRRSNCNGFNFSLRWTANPPVDEDRHTHMVLVYGPNAHGDRLLSATDGRKPGQFLVADRGDETSPDSPKRSGTITGLASFDPIAIGGKTFDAAAEWALATGGRRTGATIEVADPWLNRIIVRKN